MAFVITGGCCNDASCVDVCPVDCIRPHPGDPQFKTAEQLYIDPLSCIGCSACMFACPVSAIHDENDLPQHLSDFPGINRDYFLDQPLTPRFLDIEAKPATAPVEARVAIIGAGPSACYAIAELSEVPGIEINVFDRLPTPFGLVRSGVAPDHPDTKLVADYFQSLLQLPNVTCYFNVEVGTHISLEELRERHHAVIHAGGANGDKKLGIDGESLPGSFSAREFVSWYNGHPDFTDREFNLSGETVVVLGNGNVALDVARALIRPVEAYASTDMADHAIDALAASAVREVVIIGRRGPADAACTLPELLELNRMPGVDVRTLADEVDGGDDPSWTGNRKRKVDAFREMSRPGSPSTPGGRRITFRFGWQPVHIAGGDMAEAVHLQRTDDKDAAPEIVPAGLVLRAIGYGVSPVPGLPFDASTRTIANVAGRAIDEQTGDLISGLYCVGWAKRGPSGVIGTNRVCSRETASAVLEDLRSGLTSQAVIADSLGNILGARQPDLVTLNGWNALDAAERHAGQLSAVRRPRRKYTQVSSMLRAAGVLDGIPVRVDAPLPSLPIHRGEQ
ncbi:FAD-dependent oxidoreductase [Pseudarthrobacter sulfonivorans]|uniref:4Fe-4S binding protein n=1 Tax=Pseudarthrobacter sulfonivorans TaxID=121292 RepID=UPI00168B3692|nr:4Fe-4S binding protein [Pseudarthrobacter sulfonivorans]